ncbi:Putative auto-transporter adhesin, head GIN domain [Salinimicrobium catena]|uniref:Putative auto-transporter adhesin, head GIN domain n=1 Tax=Salinimicrobium catena TaxID=390640 RepID=A0A1H5P0S3_9FLAO|nr:head GIN domain-containing protein [Salinimicrobium catena]SDL63209.1 Putative auto-transporter adhesin, head GIN domain [Salinimicrobium catena]SEF07280.1 Putative auto-transporter adhesin, head GIN domain [Salinimicrobium catena]
MKKANFFRFLLLMLLFAACDSPDAPECLTAPGKIIQKEVNAAPFSQVVVYGKIKLFIEQGPGQKVIIEAGENLFEQVSAEVVEGKLVLEDLSSCTFFQTTYEPKVHVTIPNLTFIENAGNRMIEGVGTLEFPSIRLRSNNYDKNPEVYTNGDFRFDLISKNIYVSGDDFSNFYLTGSTDYLVAQFWAGDGRLEARELVADSIRIFHRGTNKMILNPQQSLKGEIRSTGDVISVNRPPVVEVESFYTGKLIFE